MTIEPGQPLLHYRLTEKIGEGGMGVVWKAVDTTLDRNVAIKLLPDGLAADPERLARFEREAKLLASLNHPNVASIYGIHQVPGGAHFLAMELVDGEDLQQRTARGGLPTEEALRIAFEIALGFEAAHARGIIHRDLKPANVKLTGEGGVKVLDFGLAKAMTPELSAESVAPSMSPSMSPTMTSVGSVVGMILGTASYMSPEQAKGKQVDRRTDIWSFGVVLFELLSGHRLFEGESVAETLAAVLTKEPDWSALPSSTSAKVRRLLQRCLTRDPKNRLQDIGDARIALQEVLAGDDAVAGVDAIGSAPGWSRRALPWLVLGLLSGLALGWSVVSFRAEPRVEAAAGATMRFVIPAARDIEWIANPAVAPDDRYVVFQGGADGTTGRLFLYDLESGTTRPLAGTDGAESPFISPDGRWIGFHRGAELMKLRSAGGDVVKIAQGPADYPGSAWGPDGTILLPWGWLEGLWKVSADGGEPVRLTTVDTEAGEKGHWWPRFLPNGRHALFTIWNAGAGLIDAEIAVLDVRTGEYHKVIRGADAWFLPPGHLVYYHAGSYHAIAFDLDTLQAGGEPMAVLDDATDPVPWGSELLGVTVSGRGTLVYDTEQVVPAVRLAIVKPDTEPQPLAFPMRPFDILSVSPDRRTLAANSFESGTSIVRLLDLQTGTDEPVDLTGANVLPLWRPDGSGFVFQSMRKGDFDVYFKDLRSGGPEQPILVSPTDEQGQAWSDDGTTLLVSVTQPDGTYSLDSVPTDGSADPSTLIADFDVECIAISPDGRWIAYSSVRSGMGNIYVRPFPGPVPEVRVSPNGGIKPAWSPDGTELYYVRGDNSIVAVSYAEREGRFLPGKEEFLVRSDLIENRSWEPLAVLDRRTFVVPMFETEQGPRQLKVVLNWSREVAWRLDAD